MTNGITPASPTPFRCGPQPSAPDVREMVPKFGSLIAAERRASAQPARPAPEPLRPLAPPPADDSGTEAEKPEETDSEPPPAENETDDWKVEATGWAVMFQQLAPPRAERVAKEFGAGGEADGDKPEVAAGLSSGAAGESIADAKKVRAAMLVLQLSQAGNGAAEQAVMAVDKIAGTVEATPHTMPMPDKTTRRLREAASTVSLFKELSSADGALKKPEEVLVTKEKGDKPGRDEREPGWRSLSPIQAGSPGRGGEAALSTWGDGQVQSIVQPKGMGTFLAASVPPPQPVTPNPIAERMVLPANHMRVLEVRLHPAELGSVTARLKISEDKLSVEIAADSQAGRDSLLLQESSIKASLEALGFRVDRLTIHHEARSDAQAWGGTGNPADGGTFGNAKNGLGAHGGGHRQGSARGENEAHDGVTAGAPVRGGDGDGLFI